jgi:hypothetical protein
LKNKNSKKYVHKIAWKINERKKIFKKIFPRNSWWNFKENSWNIFEPGTT